MLLKTVSSLDFGKGSRGVIVAGCAGFVEGEICIDAVSEGRADGFVEGVSGAGLGTGLKGFGFVCDGVCPKFTEAIKQSTITKRAEYILKNFFIPKQHKVLCQQAAL